MKQFLAFALLCAAPALAADRVYHCDPTIDQQYPDDAHVIVQEGAGGVVFYVTNDLSGLLLTDQMAVQSLAGGRRGFSGQSTKYVHGSAEERWMTFTIRGARSDGSPTAASLELHDSGEFYTGPIDMACAIGPETDSHYRPNQ